MQESSDPLVNVIALAVEELLRRGIHVQPEGEGWTISLAARKEGETSVTSDGPFGSISRSW